MHSYAALALCEQLCGLSFFDACKLHELMNRQNGRSAPAGRAQRNGVSNPAAPPHPGSSGTGKKADSYHVPPDGAVAPFYVVLRGRDVGIWTYW
jgi:hypothetical protein